MLGAEGAELLKGLGAGVTRGTGWAGSSFWRFQRTGKDALGKRGAADKPAKRGRKCAGQPAREGSFNVACSDTRDALV